MYLALVGYFAFTPFSNELFLLLFGMDVLCVVAIAHYSLSQETINRRIRSFVVLNTILIPIFYLHTMPGRTLAYEMGLNP